MFLQLCLPLLITLGLTERLSASALAAYRASGRPAPECESLLNEARPPSLWGKVTRLAAKIDVRDLVPGPQEFSLQDRAVRGVRLLPSNPRLYQTGLPISYILYLDFSTEQARQEWLSKLPAGTPVLLETNEGKKIEGHLEGEDPKSRYLLTRRGNRFYHLVLEWRRFRAIAVNPRAIFGPDLYLGDRTDLSFAGTFEKSYPTFVNPDGQTDSVLRQGLISSLSLGALVNIKLAGKRSVQGRLVGKDPARVLVWDEDRNGYLKDFNWEDVTDIMVAPDDALPGFDPVTLKQIPAVLDVSKHHFSEAFPGTARRQRSAAPSIGSVMSFDLGLKQPLVGVVTSVSPLVLAVKSANWPGVSAGNHMIDVALDPARVAHWTLGWAVSPRLVPGAEVVIDDHHRGEVLKIEDDGSVILCEEERYIRATKHLLLKNALGITPVTPELLIFQRLFNTTGVRASYGAKNRRPKRHYFGVSYGSNKFASQIAYKYTGDSRKTPFEIIGRLHARQDLRFLLTRDDLLSTAFLSKVLQQAPIVFPSASLTLSEALDLARELPEIIHQQADFAFVPRNTGGFAVAIRCKKEDSDEPDALELHREIAALLQARWRKLGNPESF